jgi:hypothetical protein
MPWRAALPGADDVNELLFAGSEMAAIFYLNTRPAADARAQRRVG